MPSFKSLALAGLLAAVPSIPLVAHAHTVLTAPPPRDEGAVGSDAHKAGPCGVDRADAGQKTSSYSKGAKVPIYYTETVDHIGCHKVQLSTGNDANWVTLASIDDPANPGQIPRLIETQVQLPANVTCENCTLRSVQLMIGRPCTAADTPEASSTYYSCANIRIIDGDAGPPPVPPPADAGTDATASPGSPGSDGGTSSNPGTSGGGNGGDPSSDDTSSSSNGASDGPDAGRQRNFSTPEQPGGIQCSVGWSASSPLAFLGSAGFLLGAVVLRRRSRRRA